MKIKFWGVRGSLPGNAHPYEAKDRFSFLMKAFLNSGYKSADDIEVFLKSIKHTQLHGFGTATTSVQIFNQKNPLQNLIIDGGSGIRYISEAAALNHCAQKEYHIFISHFHFDHIVGLPFFTPHFIPGYKINYYAVQPECEDVIRGIFKKPVFPVGYEDLKAHIQFNTLKPHEKVNINGFMVTPYKLDHPDPCFGFRVEKDHHVYAHAVDSEINRRTEDALGLDAPFYKNVDLLYIDAQYAEEDMTHKKGWGHGTFERAFELGTHFNIKQIYMAHYDPNATDQDIQKFKARAEVYYQEKRLKEKFIWDFIYETQEIVLR